MKIIEKKFSKAEGNEGCGKCRVYYSEKFKRKVVEKTLGKSFIRTKKDNRTQFKTSTRNNDSEILLRQKIILINKLDCCVEILDFASNPFRITMEYCEGGDLRKILDTYDVPIEDKVEMIGQILFAISKIHKFGIIHGDLKCQNIFLVNKYIPGNTNNIIIKIGDFGLSEIGGNLIFGGTKGFNAPETEYIGGSFQSDIYSIGKVMLEIMTGYPVEFITTINITNLESLKNKLPKLLNVTQFYDLVIPCLNKDPEKRPTAKLLLQIYSSLVLYSETIEKMNSIILAKYHIREKIPVDTHKHPLIVSNSEMRKSKSNWFCDICKNVDKSYTSDILSFHCHFCDYDLCYPCLEKHNYKNVNKQMLERINNMRNKKVYVKQHPHYLLIGDEYHRNYKEDDVWYCSICEVRTMGYVYSFHCKEDDFDACLNCYDNYKEERKERECCFC